MAELPDCMNLKIAKADEESSAYSLPTREYI
jgi:hypothetical protein